MTTDETAAGRRLSLALMLLVALGTLRGGGTSLAKYVSINDVPPIGYAMWQSTFAAALLLLFGTVRSGSKLPPRDRWGYFAVTGLVGTALPNCIFFFVVRQVPAGTMAVLLTLGPVITYGLAAATRLERLDPVWDELFPGEQARIVRLQEQRAGRSAVDWVLLETTPCGPMQLPTKWEHQTRRALGYLLPGEDPRDPTSARLLPVLPRPDLPVGFRQRRRDLRAAVRDDPGNLPDPVVLRRAAHVEYMHSPVRNPRFAHDSRDILGDIVHVAMPAGLQRDSVSIGHDGDAIPFRPIRKWRF